MSNANGTSSAARYFEADKNYGECGVCLCQWKDAEELIPCRHIYCKSCVEDLQECPECCTAIERRQAPNSALLELQKCMKGKCSACGWMGTYREFVEIHVKCSSKPKEIATFTSTDSTRASHAVTEYFLEEPCVGNGGTSHKRNSYPQQKSQHIIDHNNNNNINNSFPSYVPNNLRGSSLPYVTKARVSKWKESISCVASDYGLTEKDFNFLTDNWADFASYNPKKDEPELYWRDACRLLRYMNLPSHPNDVMELFHMAMQLPENGSIPFHVLCLWIPLSRRNPETLYKMNLKDYFSLLSYAHIIDVEKTGLFNEEQCKFIGEQMLMRELTASEWQKILPIVITRSAAFRHSMPLIYHNSVISGPNVKLPLHEVILLYMDIIDLKNRKTVFEDQRQEGQQGSEKRRGLTYGQRVASMLLHYNPSALVSIEELLQQHRGNEDSLLMTLVQAYGPEPP
ncbi:zinc finger protein [Trypanosoma melophagium]|uniref:zinc finger protein n=1 Tax=Trypanosoma melophagium TaxID=715481 RepID=UPI00351A4FD8|nr:zinc finger protein [Trypanosoma melophagium]